MTLLTKFSNVYKPIDIVPDGAGSAGAAPASVALAPDRLKPRVELVAPLPEVVVKLKPEVGALCPVKLKPVDPDPPPAAAVAVVFGAKLNAGAALVAGAAEEGAVVFVVKLKAAAVVAPWAGVEVGAAGGAGVD